MKMQTFITAEKSKKNIKELEVNSDSAVFLEYFNKQRKAQTGVSFLILKKINKQNESN